MPEHLAEPLATFDESEFEDWWAKRWRSSEVPYALQSALQAAFKELALDAWQEARSRFMETPEQVNKSTRLELIATAAAAVVEANLAWTIASDADTADVLHAFVGIQAAIRALKPLLAGLNDG